MKQYRSQSNQLDIMYEELVRVFKTPTNDHNDDVVTDAEAHARKSVSMSERLKNIVYCLHIDQLLLMYRPSTGSLHTQLFGGVNELYRAKAQEQQHQLEKWREKQEKENERWLSEGKGHEPEPVILPAGLPPPPGLTISRLSQLRIGQTLPPEAYPKSETSPSSGQGSISSTASSTLTGQVMMTPKELKYIIDLATGSSSFNDFLLK